MKIKLILLSLFASTCVIAQEINIGINGGLTGLCNNADYKPGGQISLGYAHFLNKQWSIGTGISLDILGSSIKEDMLSGNYSTIDNEGDSFIFNYVLNKYEEQADVWMLSIPIRMQFQSEGKNKLYASIGAKFAFPMIQEFSSSASQAKFTGKYPQYGIDELDAPLSQGFGIQTKPSSGIQKSNLSTAIIATIETGMKWNLGTKQDLYTGVFLDYGLSNIAKTTDNHIAMYNVTNPEKHIYQSILSTDRSDKVTPFSAGVTIRFAIKL